jgi:hypothetical protein
MNASFEFPDRDVLKQMSRSANPATIKSNSLPLLCTPLFVAWCETGRSLALESLAPKPFHATIPHQPMTAELPFALTCPRGFAGGLWLSAQLGCFRRPQKVGQRNVLSVGLASALQPDQSRLRYCSTLSARMIATIREKMTFKALPSPDVSAALTGTECLSPGDCG